MAHIIERFGDAWATAIVLPTLEGRQPRGVQRLEGSLLPLPGGGAYDWRGGERALLESESLALEGSWVADSITAMETKHAELMAQIGRRSRLWRNNGVTQHWRTTRMLGVDADLRVGPLRQQAYRLQFELAAMPWQGTARAPGITLSNADPGFNALNCVNSGNVRVRDAIVTVTAQTSAITRIRMAVVGISELQWDGSLAAGSTLTLDCGAKRARIGVANAYAITLTGNHRISDWLRLEPGTTEVRITRVGGGATSTAAVTFNDGWL